MAVFTEGTVTSVRTTATGAAPIEHRRHRVARGPDDEVPLGVASAVLAVVAYVPLLLTRVGLVALDTNDGVYLDPARTLRLAGGRWDPGYLFGSVIDRTNGYAFPMAPWFWLTHALHVPTWIAQRLWLGTIILLAGIGVMVLMRTMRWEGPGALPAALAYMLSPYAMQYLGTRSVVLLAWAALPWLIHFAARSLDSPGWSDPARFALCLATAGGGNLAASAYVLVAPAMWCLFAGVVVRDVPRRVLLRAVSRMAVISSGVCAWLIVGWAYAPRVELAHALFHDPRVDSARATTPSEVVRGLGGWETYIADSGRWASSVYHRWPAVILLSFVVPVIGLGGLALTRFRNRLYFIGLLVAGMVLSVGAAPVEHREASARLFKALTASSLGGVFAPSSRAVPLLTLALAVAFGAVVRAVIRARATAWWSAQLAAGLVLLATVPAVVTGRAIDSDLLLRDGVPGYWRQAAAAVNGMPADLNVLELPGQTPSYVWGTTNRPISASLFDDPVGLRTTPILGQRPTIDVLAAIDDQLRGQTLEPVAIAPLARLLAIGAIVVRHDDGEFQAAATEALRVLRSAASNLGDVVEVGTFRQHGPGSPGVTVFRVPGVQPRLRIFEATEATVVAADGRGLVDLANAGLLTGTELVVSTSRDGSRELADRVDPDTPVILTDSNRLERRAGIGEQPSIGATEAVSRSGPPSNWGGPPGERLGPTVGDDAAHIELPEGVSVSSSGYGAPDRFVPGDRPTLAFDGDIDTGWRVGRGASPIGERLVLQLPGPVTTEAIVLHQSAGSGAGRPITGVHLEFDGVRSQDVDLGAPANDPQATEPPAGHRVALTTRTFRTLAVEITAVGEGDPSAGAGFSEIEIPGVAPVVETLALPDELLRFGDRIATHPITVSLVRWRSGARDDDPEREIRRSFSLPTRGRFELAGAAHALAAVTEVDQTCRSDLVSIDGRAIPVRLEPGASGGLRLSGCEAVSAGPGVVTVVSSRLGAPGIEVAVDRLTMTSAAAATAAPGPATPPSRGEPEVALDGSTGLTIKLPKASAGVWLVRAASASSGWVATVDGNEVDESYPANGFGLAWPLDVGDGTRHTVVVRIPAQRRVGIAVIGSTVAGLLAVALALRRRRPSPSVDPPARVLRPRFVPVGVVALTTLVVFGVAGGTLPGLTAGAAALAIEYRRDYVPRIGWGGAVLLVAVGVAKAAWQLFAAEPAGPAWPGATPWLDILTWTAVAAAVTAGIGTATGRASTRYGP